MESDCSNIFISDSVDSCCVIEVAQSYRNNTLSRICNLCYGEYVIFSGGTMCGVHNACAIPFEKKQPVISKWLEEGIYKQLLYSIPILQYECTV